MRILVTSISYPPFYWFSGVGVVARNIVNILSRKNDVLVISGKPFGAEMEEDNVFRVPLFHVPLLPLAEVLQFRSGSLKIAKRLLEKYDFDYFHDHQGEGIKIASFIKKQTKNMKTICHCHGGYTPLEELGKKKYPAKVLSYLSDRVLHTNFEYDHYMAVSNFHKKELICGGVGEGKISVLYNPIDTAKFVKSKTRKERKVVYCGFLGYRKRPYWVVEAAKELRERGIEAKFVILSGGGLEGHLKKLVLRYSLEGNVEVRGFVSESEKIREYQTSLVYTLPSLWESAGQTIAEAMACEACPVVSDNSGMREMVEEGKTGLRVKTSDFNDYVDKLGYLLTNEKEARKMGRRARKFVLKNFSFPVVEEKLHEIYQKIGR